MLTVMWRTVPSVYMEPSTVRIAPPLITPQLTYKNPLANDKPRSEKLHRNDDDHVTKPKEGSLTKKIDHTEAH